MLMLAALKLVVDNTFMSPYFQRPIEFGADMVMHSTTKFLNGHSDGLGGVIAATKPIHAEKLAFMQKASGAILSPFECWLVLRGVKSLAVRMEKHDENGRAGCRLSAQSSQGEEGALSWLFRSSATRFGQAPDDRLWFHDHL